MLTELRIQDFAIIEQLTLNFGEGLSTFTGETGAGKSILIDAVETLLGARVETTLIRTGAEQAMIEGSFYLSDPIRKSIHAILGQEELLDDPDYVVLGREIRRNGRNVARVNGRSVTATLLREIGEHLVDVHGQSEHLSLLRVRAHLQLLDSYAGVEEPLENYRAVYNRIREVRRNLEMLRESERDAARRADLLAYQIDEIEAAKLSQDEEQSLKQERNRLANAENLASLTQEALFALDEGDPETPAATDLMGHVVEAIETLAETDPSQARVSERTQSIFDNLSDLALELRDYLEGIEFNPRRLQQVEERLEVIYHLKRKYGGSIPAVLEFAEKASRELDDISHAGERIEELEAEEKQLLARVAEEGWVLSEARHAAAEDLSRAVETELVHLRMEGAGFKVEFQVREDSEGVALPDGRRVAFDARGLESVQFLVAPNPGEGLKPLTKIASGGEMSRLMLALKNVLARADLTPTLIFDEIDQGIGGRVGAVVGEKLWALSRGHQVLCVTHLPQLAAYGNQHFKVLKEIKDGRTITQVEALEGEERLRELAQMMGEISEGTLQSAQEILESVSTLEISPN